MRRDAAAALLRAMQAKLAPPLLLAETSRRSREWASITFSGARHQISFTIMGEEAEKAADRLLSRLSETEFRIPGHILADIGLLSRQAGRTPEGLPCVSVTIEALTVEDC